MRLHQPDDPGVLYPPGTEVLDTPDPPPIIGYSDAHWWVLNRWAEESMRLARLIGLLALVLVISSPACAETSQLTFCDTPDEIAAVTIYGHEAIPVINAKFPNACTTLVIAYIRGDRVETVKADGKLWDITPVLIYGVGWYAKPVNPVEQWVSFTSLLVEANY